MAKAHVENVMEEEFRHWRRASAIPLGRISIGGNDEILIIDLLVCEETNL